jgi:hypothetical protein
MRCASLTGVVVLVAATAASAAPASPLRPLAPAVPTRRADLASVPASAITTDPDFAAHVSVANCMAEDEMAAVALHPDQASTAALETAIAPSLAIFDDVIAHGNASWRAIADAAKADLFDGMIVRIRSVTNDPQDHAGLESKMMQWSAQADAANRDAAQVAQR